MVVTDTLSKRPLKQLQDPDTVEGVQAFVGLIESNIMNGERKVHLKMFSDRTDIKIKTKKKSKMVLKETQTFRVYNPSSVWRQPLKCATGHKHAYEQ